MRFALAALLAVKCFGQYTFSGIYCASSTGTDSYACTLNSTIVSYQTGAFYAFKADVANTGTASVNFNSLGAKTIVVAAGGVTTTLSDNAIRAGQMVVLQYDGTNMQMQSTSGIAPSTISSTCTGTDLTGTLPGCTVQAVGGFLVPLLVARIDLTAQAANVGSTLLYAIPSTGAGRYRVSCYMVVTQAATNSSTLPNCGFGWTDKDTGTVIGATSAVLTATSANNTVGNTNSTSSQPHNSNNANSAIVQAAASSNLNYSANAYASNGVTPMQYALHITAEYLGP